MKIWFLEIPNPYLFWLGCVIIFAIFFSILSFFFLRKKRFGAYDVIYKKFSDKKFTIKILFVYFLYSLIFFLFLCSLTQTKIVIKNIFLETKNPDIIFLLDSSYSMYASDISGYKNRFFAAKKLVSELTQKSQNNSVSLFLFSGKTLEYIPENTDKIQTIKMIENLEIEKFHKSPEWLSGSSLGDGILLTAEKIENGKKPVLIIASDGGITQGISPEDALSLTKNDFEKVIYISLGSLNSIYTYVPKGKFGIGEKVLIDGRDDSIKRYIGKNFYIFENENFISDFTNIFLQNKKIVKNAQNFDIFSDKTLFFSIFVIFVGIFILHFGENFVGKWEKIYKTLIVCEIVCIAIFIYNPMTLKSDMYIIDSQQSKNILREYFAKNDSGRTDISIGFYNSLGELRVALPAGVKTKLALKKIDKIPIYNVAQISLGLYDFGEKNDKKILFLCVIYILGIVIFVIFLYRYLWRY